MRRALFAFLAVMTVFCLICGCATKGPILVDMGYRPPQGLKSGVSGVLVGVSPFQDDRGEGAATLGKRAKASGAATSDLVVQGTVADIVTNSFKQALQKRGAAVKSLPPWDMSSGQVPLDTAGADILIGGSIKTLWAGVVSKTVKESYKVEVKIRLALADTADRNVLRYLNLNSSQEREDVKFSPELVGTLLSEALSTAIEQLLNDPQFESRLH